MYESSTILNWLKALSNGRPNMSVLVASPRTFPTGKFNFPVKGMICANPHVSNQCPLLGVVRSPREKFCEPEMSRKPVFLHPLTNNPSGKFVSKNKPLEEFSKSLSSVETMKQKQWPSAVLIGLFAEVKQLLIDWSRLRYARREFSIEFLKNWFAVQTQSSALPTLLLFRNGWHPTMCKYYSSGTRTPWLHLINVKPFRNLYASQTE